MPSPAANELRPGDIDLARVDAIIAQFDGAPADALPVLHALQREFHYLLVHRTVLEFAHREHIMTVAMRVIAGDLRKAHRAHRPFAQHPQHAVNSVNAGVDMVAAAQRDIIAPDQVLEAAFLRGRPRRVGPAAAKIAAGDYGRFADLACADQLGAFLTYAGQGRFQLFFRFNPSSKIATQRHGD